MNLCPGGLGFIVRGACANNYVSRGVRVHCPGVGGGGIPLSRGVKEHCPGVCANKLLSRGVREHCPGVVDKG